MERTIYVFLAGLLMLSCAKSSHENPKSVNLSHCATKSSELELKIDISHIDTTYFVSRDDIDKYLHFKKLLDPKIVVKDITPFELQGVTLFYILNYEEGWEMISADKRTQPVLGQAEKGSFLMKEYEETPWGTWAYTLGLDVLNERLYGKNSTLEENENMIFWASLEGPVHTSAANRPIIIEPGPDTGYYELVSVRLLDVYDTIDVPHLTTTLWRQSGYSYGGNYGNPFVPFKSNGTQYRAPSGCVAVAGAQQAYYMHQNFGKPLTAPSEGYCNDVVRQPYDWANPYAQYFSEFNSQIWDDMQVNNNMASDLLIGYIGQKVYMKYGNTTSTTSTSYLINYFSENDILCDCDDYDDSLDFDVIYEQLYLREMPIIMAAYDFNGSGHSFIIDSYKYLGRKLEYKYEWHWYPGILGNGYIIPDIQYAYVYSYEYSSTQFIRMNWGWFTSTYNDMEFAPRGSWAPGGGRAFDYYRYMLYNFQY